MRRSLIAPISARRDRHDVGGHRHRLAVEVPAGEHLARVREDHRVVRGRVHLHPHGRAHVGEGVPRRAVDLGHAAQAVGVLHLAAVAVRLADGAPREELAQVARGGGLPGVGAGGVDARVEGDVRAPEGVEAHGRQHVRGAGQPLGLGEGEAGHRGHELRAVDEGEALLGLERDGGEAGGPERFRARERRAFVDGAAPSPATTSARWARGARSPLAPTDPGEGTTGWTRAVQHRDQQVERLRADAAVALGQHVRAQQHERARLRLGERLADPRGVAAHEVQLELAQAVPRDVARRRSCRSRWSRRRRQRPRATASSTTRRGPDHRVARPAAARATGRRAARHRLERLEVQPVAVQKEWRGGHPRREGI